MKLIIIVPCFNEEEVLHETNHQLSKLIDSMVDEKLLTECDIIYVDDGSKDNTWSIIEELRDVSPYVRGLKLAHNMIFIKFEKWYCHIRLVMKSCMGSETQGPLIPNLKRKQPYHFTN